MSDQNGIAPTGHNLPSARNFLHDMRRAAHLFVSSDQAAETHLLSVMVCAYRLRQYRDESPAQQDEIDGLLGKIPDTARTPIFTRLLKIAFHKDEVDKSRISRCAAALQHAFVNDVPADDLHTFIEHEGGIVKCGQKAKGASGDATTPKPEPIPIPCDPTGIDLKGHISVAGTMRQTEVGWQFTPSKVLSPVRQPGRRTRKLVSQPEPAPTA